MNTFLEAHLEQGELSKEENLIFIALMNPRFPKRIRSLNGIAAETGLSPNLILELLLSEKHFDYLLVGKERDTGKFSLDSAIFEARHPLFLWSKRN